MANAYSILHNYSNANMYTPDFQLIQTGLELKTNKLNANREKLQTAYDNFTMLDVAKGVDKEHLEERLQQVKDITNKYMNMDLSSEGLTRSLLQNMGQIVDDKVKTAVLSTKVYRAEQAEWEDMRKNHSEKYSETNHEFALRGAKAWLNGSDAGQAYGGGGGFIEYRDVGKKLFEMAPELQKLHGYEYIETGPMEGYFRSTDKFKTISRTEMNSALNTILDEKDLKQLQINAWAKYDKLGDEDLKGAYEEYVTPKIESQDEYIETLESAMSNASAADKEAYEAEIAKAKEIRNSLSVNDYEKVVKEAGREGLYTTMYVGAFKDNILNAYSRSPKMIEQKVNELDKHNRAHEVKLAELELKSLKAKEDKGVEGFIPGEAVATDTDEEKASVANAEIHAQHVLRGQVAETLKEELGLGTDSDVEDLMRSKDFVALVTSDLAGRKTVNVGGKEIRLTPLLRERLLTYKDAFIDNPVKEEAYKSIGGMVDKTVKAIGQGLINKDSEDYNIPNMNLRYKKVGESWTLEKVPFEKGKNHYAELLRKNTSGGKLTEAEKKELKLYSALHLLNDGHISNNQRRLVKEYTIKLMEDVDSKGFKTVKLDAVVEKGETMPNTYSTITTADLWMTEFTSGDVRGNAITRLIGANKAAGKLRHSETLTNKEVKEQVLRSMVVASPEKLILEGLGGVERVIDQAYMENYNLGESRGQTLTKKGNALKHAQLASLIGADSTISSDIKVFPVLKDGVPTKEAIVSVVVGKDKDKNDIVKEKKVTYEELEKFKIAKIDVTRNIKYDAKKTFARSVDLGSGSYGTMAGAGFSYDDKKMLLDDSERFGDRVYQETARLINEYAKGNYKIKLEPKGGEYGYTIYKQGADGLTQPLPEFFYPVGQTIDNGEMSKVLDNPKPTVDLAFARYISYYQDILSRQEDVKNRK